MWRSVAWSKFNDVSENPVASNFRKSGDFFNMSVNFYQTSAPYCIMDSHFCEDVTSHTYMTQFLKKLSTFLNQKVYYLLKITLTTDPASLIHTLIQYKENLPTEFMHVA
jgi:hypothetical protein